MTQKCALSGKRSGKGNKVSHANNRSIRRFHVNTHREKVFSEAMGRYFSLTISTRVLRTIDFKGGFDAYLLSRRAATLSRPMRRLQQQIRSKQ